MLVVTTWTKFGEDDCSLELAIFRRFRALASLSVSELESSRREDKVAELGFLTGLTLLTDGSSLRVDGSGDVVYSRFKILGIVCYYDVSWTKRLKARYDFT